MIYFGLNISYKTKTKMKIKDGYILKEFGGEAVVIRNDMAKGHNSVIELNETGIVLWKALQTETDIDTLAKALTDEYDVNYDKAEQDARAFVDTLTQAGIIG